jgi:hypothetical protein
LYRTAVCEYGRALDRLAAGYDVVLEKRLNLRQEIANAIVAGRAFPGMERLRNALPLVVLLTIWTSFAVNAAGARPTSFSGRFGK